MNEKIDLGIIIPTLNSERFLEHTLMAMWHAPSGSGLLVGHGVDLPLSNSLSHSDMGYVIQIYYGGLLYLFALIATHLLIIPWRSLWHRRMYT
jgi:hypothetical protein